MVKVISLSNDAYSRLKMIKGDRSFSEIVVEITSPKKKANLMDFFGIWADKKENVIKMKKMIDKDRESFKLRGVKP